MGKIYRDFLNQIFILCKRYFQKNLETYSYDPEESVYFLPSERSNPIHILSDFIFFIFPVQELSFFNSASQKLEKNTENLWSSFLVASILHNFRKTGKIALDSKGIATEVNFKSFLPPERQMFEVGCSFVEIVSKFQKQINMNDSLYDLTNQLRSSLSTQINNKIHFKQMLSDLEESHNEKEWKNQMASIVSPCITINLNYPIKDMIFVQWMAQESFHGFCAVVNYLIKTKSFFDYSGYFVYDPYIISRIDANLVLNDILNSLKKNSLNMKLIDAIHNLNKTI